MKKKKKKVRRFILIGLSAVILIAVLIFWRNPHFFYIMGEIIGVNREKVELQMVIPDYTVKSSVASLESDDRIRFDQSAMLINSDHLLPDDFAPSLSQYKDTDVQVNECLVTAYAALSQAVTEETGSRLFVSSAFRTQEEQRILYEDDPSVANLPGSSEHQTGLALDVYVKYYAGMGFIKTEAGQFVNSNCWKYGFIIRYPVLGKPKTGMKYEPWHIRYVGEPHAKIIYHNHLTLEEYIDSFEEGAWYEAGGYLISRQKADEDGILTLPDRFAGATISSDNTGSYMITLKQ